MNLRAPLHWWRQILLQQQPGENECPDGGRPISTRIVHIKLLDENDCQNNLFAAEPMTPATLSFAIAQYSWQQSMPRYSRPSFFAAAAAVPLPRNGSRTTPSAGQPAKMQFFTSTSGNTAKCAPRNLESGIDQTVRLFR